MKSKTISKNIAAKVAEWSLSLNDEALAKECEKHIIVTGGCIASMYLQQPVNDYDVYFDNNGTVLKLAIHYIKKQLMSKGCRVVPMVRLTFANERCEVFRVNDVDDEATRKFKVLTTWTPEFEQEIERVEIYVKSQGFSADDTKTDYKYFEYGDQDRTTDFVEDASDSAVSADNLAVKGQTKGDVPLTMYRPIFMSSNAITLSDKFQIVLRFTGDPAVIHESFDFVHATNYWTKETGLITNAQALECLLAKELVYRGSLYPLASIFRTRKFIQREWTCHIGNYLKMALQLNEFDLNDPKTLEEQLTGVDAAYLHEIIKAVKQKKAEAPDFKFNAQYMCALVERMMG